MSIKVDTRWKTLKQFIKRVKQVSKRLFQETKVILHQFIQDVILYSNVLNMWLLSWKSVTWFTQEKWLFLSQWKKVLSEYTLDIFAEKFASKRHISCCRFFVFPSFKPLDINWSRECVLIDWINIFETIYNFLRNKKYLSFVNFPSVHIIKLNLRSPTLCYVR